MFRVVLLVLAASVANADVLTATWNIRWFPSGRAEHRAPPSKEKATVNGAAELVRNELARRRRPGDHVILFFQEMRDEAVCSNLVAAIGDKTLSLASMSAFREFDRRLGWQQSGIASDLPVVEASFSYWRRARKILPPRGFTYALLDGGEDGLIACYCVHLKSNYGSTTPEIRESNRLKRELAMEHFRALTKKVQAPDGRRVTRFILAGDFNTDPFSGAFNGERTIGIVTDAGFVNCFAGMPLEARGTHPGNRRYPDSTIDFIFHRGFSGQSDCELSPVNRDLSDHRMVWLRLR